MKTKDQIIAEIKTKTIRLEALQMRHDIARKNGALNDQSRLSNEMEKLADSIAPLQLQLSIMDDGRN